MGLILPVLPWEWAHANEVAANRQAMRWETSDAPHYDRSRMEDDRTASVAAAVCEAVVARHFGVYWMAGWWSPEDHKTYREFPDLVGPTHHIEVKRVRNPDSNPTVAVRAADLRPGVLLAAAWPQGPEFRKVTIYGALPTQEAWDLGIPADYGNPAEQRRVSIDHFRHDDCRCPQ